MGKEKMYYEEMGYEFDPPFYAPTSKPIVTNYDRMISKTPEELANEFAGQCPSIFGGYSRAGEDCAKFESCQDCWLDWLKQEAK